MTYREVEPSHGRSRRRPAAIGVVVLLMGLLAACATPQNAAPAPPVAQQARNAPVQAPPPAKPATKPARPRPDPRIALAAQIRSALSRRSWPASIANRPTPGPVPEWGHDGCLDVQVYNEQRCTFGPKKATRSLALIGDSIAMGWLPGLRRAESMKTTRIHVLTHRQCPNLRGEASPSCASHLNWALKRVRALHPDIAVLSSDYDGKEGWYAWRTGLRRTLAAVKPYAKTVIVIAPHPDLAVALDCFKQRIAPGACRTNVPLNWREYGEAERQAALANGARFVDPRPWVCIDEVCPALIGDTPVSFDGNHLSGAFAERLGPVLSRAIG